jgi:phosphate transport system substrate-binding protein
MSASTRFLSRCFCLILLLLPTPLLAETLTIPGTGDGTAILRALAAAFHMQNPGLQIEIPDSIGSSGGIKVAGKGEAVLARVARKLNAKEQSIGLSYRAFAKVPAVFFITKDIPIEYLSSAQICDIYRGKINNWQQVGGPDLPIRVVRREEGDSTLSVLRQSFPGFAQIEITAGALTATKTPEMFNLMTKENQAIGFGPYDLAENSPVRIVKVDGRGPTFSDYPSVTTLAFVYLEPGLTASARKFLDFATSTSANLPIIAAGGIPIN